MRATIAVMAKQNEHGRLIAAAAKAALAPLGCKRKGQSRLWYSDQRFWVISIEFQPSAWSKGSYLNVGATWLWHARPGFGFDMGYRVADFVPFENADQFGPSVAGMAARAAKEVIALRERFRSVADVYRYLVPLATSDGWRLYHAAVAAGLVGDVDTAHRLFQQFEAWAVSPQWQTKLQTECVKLAGLLNEPIIYRSAVLDIIEQRRQLIGLPSDPYCLGELDSTI